MCCTCISGRAEGIYGRHDNDRGPRHVEGGQTNRHVLSNSDETGNLTENKYVVDGVTGLQASINDTHCSINSFKQSMCGTSQVHRDTKKEERNS